MVLLYAATLQHCEINDQSCDNTGIGSGGKRRRHFETVRGRKSDAQRRLTELLASLDQGIYTSPGKVTVAQHLRNWLDDYIRINCSQRTLDGYRAIIEHHLIPALVHILLRQLTAQVIQTYYGKACDKLSTRTVHHQHRVLSQAFKYGVRQGYLARNPCELVDPPSPYRKIMRTLDPTEVNILLEAAQES